MATAPTPLASVDDLADYIGEAISSDVDVARAGWALRAASALVRRETGGKTWLSEDGKQVAAGTPDDVILTTLAAASRKYLNPEGMEQERDDEWYGARKVEEAGVYLTESEQTLLAALVEGLPGGIGTIGVTRGDIGRPRTPINPVLPPYYMWE